MDKAVVNSVLASDLSYNSMVINCHTLTLAYVAVTMLDV